MKISLGPEFKHVISSLNEIVDSNLSLECKKTGLYCMAHDDATVCLIEVFIHQNSMLNYEVETGETLTVDMNLLQKIMKTIKYDSLHLTKTKKDTLMISSEGNRNCEFELPLLDTIDEHMEIPDIDYDCIFNMNKTIFQGVCKDLKQFGEEIIVRVTKDKITFSTKDEIECKIEVEEVEIENEESVDIQKKYDLKYFLKMLKANSLTSDITFYQSSDMPLVVEYKMENDEESYIRYYLGNMV